MPITSTYFSYLTCKYIYLTYFSIDIKLHETNNNICIK